MSKVHSGQHFANHKQLVPGYHYFLLFMATVTLIGSCVNLTEAICHKEGVYSASLICSISLMCVVAFLYMRSFALKAQDRAIRAEENLRHFALTGKLLDARLRMGQIIALRFAPDAEFVALAARAATEGMKVNEIKKAIQNWRGDYYRV